MFFFVICLEMGPSLGSSSRLELFFRLEVNKLKARAQSSLILKSSIQLFSVSNPKFIIKVCRARQKLKPNFTSTHFFKYYLLNHAIFDNYTKSWKSNSLHKWSLKNYQMKACYSFKTSKTCIYLISHMCVTKKTYSNNANF